MMEMRLLFKHYPQIRRVSSFTVYAFKVSTFLQSSVYYSYAIAHRPHTGIFVKYFPRKERAGPYASYSKA